MHVALHSFHLPLECNFGCKLHQAWRRGFDNSAKRIAINIPVHSRWPEELCVIERVERFQPELELPGFREFERLQDREVEIELPGTVKEPS